MQTELLLQMLAMRRGGSGAPNVAELMAQIQGGGFAGNGGASPMPDLLRQLSQRNPMAAQLAQQLGLGAAPVAHRDDSVVDEQTIEVSATEVDEPADVDDSPRIGAAVRRADLHRETGSLGAELIGLRERVDRCAAALGACGVCWGTDAGCRACRGRGRPGFSIPDDGLFAELVLPAMRTMKAHRMSASARSAGALPPRPSQIPIDQQL
jgi:hypothetical protein